MLGQKLLLIGLISLGGACKKEEPELLKPTLFAIQVIYQQSRQPVDSAHVIITGTKGTYLSGRDIQRFLSGYTDEQGRLQASMMIPRDYYTTYVTGKVVKIGNHWKEYSVISRQPSTDVLKHEQENIIVAELDTLK
jgi:hypothetical protein